jgi:ABC-type spermidine/putrescine transport system permease subunit II
VDAADLDAPAGGGLTGVFNPIPRNFHGIENYATQGAHPGASAALHAERRDRLRGHPRRAAAGRHPGGLCAGEAALSRARRLFAWCSAALCIPIQVPALPLYLGLAQFGLLDTYFALMLPFFLSAFAIFLFRQVFMGFPEEIVQAARLDGMGEFEIVWRLVAPAARPAIAAFSVFSIVAHWNDLYWPLIVITETRLAPPPLGMMYFRDAETGANYGALMAGATILTAPLVIAFLIAADASSRASP